MDSNSILTGLTKKQEFTLAIEICIICIPSVLFLVFTLYCYIKFQHLNNAQFKLVTRILFSDLIYEAIMSSISLGYLITYDENNQTYFRDTHPIFCYIEAYLSNFSILTSTAWTSIICHTLYMQVYKNIQQIYYYQYIFVGYIIPTIISFIPFYVDGYGVTYPMESTNCFYNMRLSQMEYNLYITFCYYLPIWIAFIYNFIIISLVVKKILKHITEFTNKTQIYALFIYPTILFICWVVVQPGLVQQFNPTSIVWQYLSQFFCNILGLLDALCYCFTEIFTKLRFNGCQLELEVPIEDTNETSQTSQQLTQVVDSQQL